MIIFAFIAVTIFLLGLYQWAQSGAGLLQIFRLKRQGKSLSRAERKENENEVQRIERATDRALRASFRMLGVLAVLVWVFLGVTVVLDMFGIDLIGKLSSRAQVYWSQPSVTNTQSTVNRNNVLRNMGTNLRK